MLTRVERYYPFLDGALGYDCQSCGGHCCQGWGFGVTRPELAALLDQHPDVGPFVQTLEGCSAIFDLSEGCWFLKSARCSLEEKAGYHAKPLICQLFPFTRRYRIGNVDVVEPHVLHCNLTDDAVHGVHCADLEEALRLLGDDAPLLPVTLPAGLPDDWLALERHVLDASRDLLIRHDLVATQAIDGERTQLDNLWQSWQESFALDPPLDQQAAAVARGLMLLTPLLRCATLFSGAIASPYPKLRLRLPALILATGFFTCLAARALGRKPQLRSIVELHRSTGLERELLARWHNHALLMSPLKAVDAPTAVRTALEQLSDALANESPKPLGKAFLESAGNLDPALRFVMLRALSNHWSLLHFS